MSSSSSESNTDPIISQIKSALFLLFSQPEVQTFFSSSKITCKNNLSHPCIITDTVSLFKSHKSPQLLSSLHHSILNHLDKSEQVNSNIDAIDILSIFLINFHCYSVNFQCFSEAVQHSVCSSDCLLHSLFYLNIKELITCKKGHFFTNNWEYFNICQYFNGNQIIGSLDLDLSKTLSVVPKYLLALFKAKSNSVICKNSLIPSISRALNEINIKYCSDTDCTSDSSLIRFEVAGAPIFYIVSLLYNEDNFTYLQSLLLTLSIQTSFNILDIYNLGDRLDYYLTGVIFSGKKNKYAELTEKGWLFHKSFCGNWIEVVKKALLRKLYPAALIYRQGSAQIFQFDDLKIMKLEQEAVRLDSYSSEHGEIALNEGISQLKHSKIQLKSNENPNTWVCECRKQNSDEFEVCQVCYKLKAGVEGWVCVKCKVKNQLKEEICEVCETSKDGKEATEQDYWICGNCDSAISSNSRNCEFCQVKLGASTPNIICPYCRKKTKASAYKCYWCHKSLKREESQWTCFYCKAENPDFRKACLNCQKKRETKEKEKEENWECKNCEFSNLMFKHICGNCKISRLKKSSDDWYCSGCFVSVSSENLVCPKCKKSANEVNEDNKEIFTCLSCENGITYVICLNCQKLNLKKDRICSECGFSLDGCLFCKNCVKKDGLEYLNEIFGIDNR